MDLRIPGRGIDFELKRRYRSKTGFTDRTGETGPIGNNWDHSYNIFLTRAAVAPAGPERPPNTPRPPGRAQRLTSVGLVLHDGRGRGELFTFDAEVGAFTRAEHFAVIEWDGEGSPVMKTADIKIVNFFPS